jgi:hypothetical protein
MKTKCFLAMAALMLSVCVATAQNPGGKGQGQKRQQTYFVDKDGDGICDNYVAKVCKYFVNLNKCKNPDCTGFVDANGDGKCDNCTNPGTCTPVGAQPKDGTGLKKGKK